MATPILRKYYEHYEMLLAAAILSTGVRLRQDLAGADTSKCIQWKLLQYFSTETVLHHLLS